MNYKSKKRTRIESSSSDSDEEKENLGKKQKPELTEKPRSDMSNALKESSNISDTKNSTKNNKITQVYKRVIATTSANANMFQSTKALHEEKSGKAPNATKLSLDLLENKKKLVKNKLAVSLNLDDEPIKVNINQVENESTISSNATMIAETPSKCLSKLSIATLRNQKNMVKTLVSSFFSFGTNSNKSEPFMAISFVELVQNIARFELDGQYFFDDDYDWLKEKLDMQSTKTLLKNLGHLKIFYSNTKIVRNLVDFYTESLEQKLKEIKEGAMPDAEMPEYPRVEKYLKSKSSSSIKLEGFKNRKETTKWVGKYGGIKEYYSITCEEEGTGPKSAVIIKKTQLYYHSIAHQIKEDLSEIDHMKNQ